MEINKNEIKLSHMETFLHEVIDISAGQIEKKFLDGNPEPYYTRDLLLEFEQGHTYRLTLFGRHPGRLSVRFSG